MTLITEAEVRSLAARHSADGIVSCYLDVDGRRHVRPADYERSLGLLIQKARANGHAEDIEADLARITERVKQGFDRSRVRGVAVFSGQRADVWEVVELPVSVRDQLVVNVSPAVGQLEAVMEESLTLGMLISDRVHARVVVYRLDEIVHDVQISGEIDSRTDAGGPADRGTPDRHREEKVNQNLRRAAELLWETHQSFNLDNVVIGASEQTANALVESLHPYLRDRMHSVMDIDPSASAAVIREAAFASAMEIERKREQELVDQLRDALASGSPAVAGLADVLAALYEDRIATMLVSTGYSDSGWSCPECGRLATFGPTCDCGAAFDSVDNVVEMAIERAFERGIDVEMCTDNADLDVHGRIGAMLRY